MGREDRLAYKNIEFEVSEMKNGLVYINCVKRERESVCVCVCVCV